MTDTRVTAVEPIEGERSIPSINAAKRKSGRGLGIGLLLLFAVAGAVGAYSWWAKSRRSAETEAPPKAEAQAAASSTKREFGVTPPAPPAPPPELDVAPDGGLAEVPPIETAEGGQRSAAPPGPRTVSEAQGGAAAALPPAQVDKSRSGMMVGGGDSAAGVVSGVNEAITGLDPRVAAMVKSGSTPASGSDQGGMSDLLAGTATVSREAVALPNRNYLLAKGTMIECGLRPRIDTSVPGQVVCMTTRNIYSDNGKVVLIERGSLVEGEYTGGLQQGQNRIFVLWTRVRTPSGIAIGLDSPGTDQLGASGLSGKVNNHFWKRFGAAMLMSIVDDAAAFAANRNGNSATTVNLGNTQDAASDMAAKVLETTANIPPTLYKQQGDRINIIVARDLNFGEVYELRTQ
ncbi:Conjugation TrbI family protein [Xanthomonas citri pv. fuscans]|nr:Conjugation TrbI family protein [Xanthomonas citri pv. fuscans]